MSRAPRRRKGRDAAASRRFLGSDRFEREAGLFRELTDRHRWRGTVLFVFIELDDAGVLFETGELLDARWIAYLDRRLDRRGDDFFVQMIEEPVDELQDPRLWDLDEKVR